MVAITKTEYKPKYISGIWFREHQRGNILVTLTRDDTHWYISLRVRTYVDDKIHDSEDIKNFHGYKSPIGGQTEDEIRDSVTGAAEVAGNSYSPIGKFVMSDFVDLKCMEDDKKVLDEMRKRPWAHMKVVKGPDAEKIIMEMSEEGSW